MAKRPSPSSRAEQFRKRADAIGKRLKKTANKKEQAPLRKKQRALNDMADKGKRQAFARRSQQAPVAQHALDRVCRGRYVGTLARPCGRQ